MLFVDPEFQGLGIGRALVLRLLEEARAMGYSTMRVDTSRHMVSAQRLYGSLGFREVEQYDDRHDSLADIKVFMERSLG